MTNPTPLAALTLALLTATASAICRGLKTGLCILIIFASTTALAGGFNEIGKSVKKSVKDIGNSIEKGAHDTGKTIEKGAHDAGKSIEKRNEVQQSPTDPCSNRQLPQCD